MRNDSEIRQDVLDEVGSTPSIDANDIGVGVEDGIVTLSGYVSNYNQKLAVERAATRVKGVRGIAQEIEVRYPGGPGTSDDEIAKRVVNTLKWNTVLPDEKVQVKVQDGWVTLSGQLNWKYQKDAAEDAIRDVKGIKGVVNLIELAPQVATRDVKTAIFRALHRNAQLEAEGIQVTVDGSTVVLGGKVKAWHERKVAEDAAWGVPGVLTVEDHMNVR